MINDKNIKELLDDLQFQLNLFSNEMHNSKDAINKAYYEGVVEGLERSINNINFFNCQSRAPTKKPAVRRPTTRKPARK